MKSPKVLAEKANIVAGLSQQERGYVLGKLQRSQSPGESSQSSETGKIELLESIKPLDPKGVFCIVKDMAGEVITVLNKDIFDSADLKKGGATNGVPAFVIALHLYRTEKNKNFQLYIEGNEQSLDYKSNVSCGDLLFMLNSVVRDDECTALPGATLAPLADEEESSESRQSVMFEDGTVEKIIDDFDNENLCAESFSSILKATNSHGVMKAFFIEACLDDSHRALNFVFHFLPSMGFESTQIKEILSAKNSERDTGLFWAMHNGRTDTVKAFLVALPALGLDKDQIKEILLSEDSESLEDPGLCWAMENGHADTVKAFLEALPAFELDKDQIKEILLAKSSYVGPVLLSAMKNDHASTVKVFLEALPALGLDKDQIKEILLAKDSAGVTGLCWAMENGRTDTVKAFLEALPELKEACGLTNVQITEILLAKDENGCTGLCGAMEFDEADTVKAFQKALPKLGLDKDQIKEILLRGNCQPSADPSIFNQVSSQRGQGRSGEGPVVDAINL